MALPPTPRQARLAALRHRDFRLFWSGQLVSLIGTWMQSVGQAWLVLELTGSAFQLGLVTALQFAPILVLSPVGGALSDRFPKRRIILLTQATMMAQAFVLAALVWSGHVRYWHVAILAAIYGLGRAIDIPARQAYITDLVGKSDLPNAVALNSLVFNGARIVGPAVAGLLIARFGVALAFFLNGLSFLAVLAALIATRTPGDPHPGGQLGIREGLWGALAYAARTPPASFTLALLVVVSLLVLNFNVLVPLVAKDVLNEGAHGFGLLMSSLGAGAVMAAVGLTLLRRGRPPLWSLAASAAILSAGTACLALVGHFAATAALLVVLGCCQILFSTGCNTTLQLDTPDSLRGRVMGLYALAFAGMTPFGSLLVGTIAEHLGVRAACALGGGGGLAAVAALVLIGRRAGLVWTHGREW
ncbi:MAG TPA: MFS transporter [Candidatus Methylomirabilis sp.]|nr:MFS transporter [Candidatus Methylomirabilis sp.]